MSKFFYLGRKSGDVANLKEYLEIVCAIICSYVQNIPECVDFVITPLFRKEYTLIIVV